MPDEPPYDPDEEPPDERPGWNPDLDAESLDHIDRANRDAIEADAASHLRHLGAVPDNVRHLTPGEQIRHAVGRDRSRRAREAGHPDLDAFLAEPEPEYDWLIDGLLERGERVILTGQEGAGKSTLLRQIAVQISSGIHPFTLDPITPKRVLLLDVENPRRIVRRALKPLRLSAGDHYTAGFMIPILWPEGLDLRREDDAERLSHVLKELGTDLLILGPSYKLASGDPTTEDTAKSVIGVLDELRTRHDFSLILEAHQPYAATPGAKRAERPYGASLWSRWPEFGLHLADDGALRHWRGDRDVRDWPEALKRGGEWPWTAITGAGVTWARMKNIISDAGKELTHREIADAYHDTSGTKVSHSTVGRAIKANKAEYDALLRRLGIDPA